MPPALRSSRPRSFRSIAIALLCTLLSGCATYRAAYETRLIGSLPNQRGVSIEESRAFPGEVLCGRYTSFNGPGFSLATQDFVVTPREVFANATALQRSVYCVPKPQAALLEATGLGAWDEDMQRARRLRDDMRAAEVAIHLYHMRHAMMPLTLEDMTGGISITARATRLTPGAIPTATNRVSPGAQPRSSTWRVMAPMASRAAPAQMPTCTSENWLYLSMCCECAGYSARHSLIRQRAGRSRSAQARTLTILR